MVKYIKERLGVFVACLIGGAIMPLFTCRSCLEYPKFYFLVGLYTACIWLVQWLGNEALSHNLDKVIKWTEKPVLRLLAGIVGMVIYTTGATLIIVFVFKRFTDLNLGSLDVMIYSTIGVTAFITLILTSRAFFLNWRQVAINAEQLERESIQAKYDALRSQVNPHFLFNSLNVLTNLVYEDPDRAVQFIQQLSQVYRYVLDTRDKEVVTLEEELNFLKAYVFLQRIRFGSKLKVDIDVSEFIGGSAPLSRQMLVENAIKHNVVSAEHPLHIHVFQKDGMITVENNLQLKAESSESSTGLGLGNIQKRYQFLHDTPVEIVAGPEAFTVRLPVLDKVAI